MIDAPSIGPMAMVKIDGGKIKKLREEQGLTQLYLATAVEVTTDTISRWENKRYPTIKKENGVKLAEALNVTLDDLLLAEPEPKISSEVHSEPTAQHPEPVLSVVAAQKKIWPLLLLSLAVLLVVSIIGWFWLHSFTPPEIKARRILPHHAIPGQPFPVLISIDGISEDGIALIVKEQIPENGSIMSTFPEASAVNTKTNEIKWLGKYKVSSIFAYTAEIHGATGTQAKFTGSAAIGKDSDDPTPLGGTDTITLGEYHWADTDMDNTISDKEILSVYDQYSELKDIDLRMDTIEEIWLGSGYKWNPKTNSYIILD